MPLAGDTPPLRDPRRADGRNGAFGSPDSPMSRAEKFEDEKKRIIGSCFNKKDSDGACAWALLSVSSSIRRMPPFQEPKLRCGPKSCDSNAVELYPGRPDTWSLLAY